MIGLLFIMHHKKGHLSVVGYLVNQGADINAKDRFRKTPIRVASQEDYSNDVEFLLSQEVQ